MFRSISSFFLRSHSSLLNYFDPCRNCLLNTRLSLACLLASQHPQSRIFDLFHRESSCWLELAWCSKFVGELYLYWRVAELPTIYVRCLSKFEGFSLFIDLGARLLFCEVVADLIDRCLGLIVGSWGMVFYQISYWVYWLIFTRVIRHLPVVFWDFIHLLYFLGLVDGHCHQQW